jgi:hypothetical protein
MFLKVSVRPLDGSDVRSTRMRAHGFHPVRRERPSAPYRRRSERASAPPERTEIAPSDNIAAPTMSVDVVLERVLAAVTTAVAGRRRIAVPERGI